MRADRNPIRKRNLTGIGRVVVCCCLLVAASFDVHAEQAKRAPETLRPVQEFVQSFYDWYVPTALVDNPTPAWIRAIREKKTVFSPQLASALEEDFSAQNKSLGDIVGLDFDPFLYTQDPGERYVVGSIAESSHGYLVEIHQVKAGKKSEPADVVVELSGDAGHWCLVNFHYAQGKDLLTILKSLRRTREKHT